MHDCADLTNHKNRFFFIYWVLYDREYDLGMIPKKVTCNHLQKRK
jgi:hypothetical protein